VGKERQKVEGQKAESRKQNLPKGTSVALQENVKFEQKGKEIRGVSRLNSRVRVAIECSEDGQTVRAEGYTKDISTRGCLAVVPHAFAVGQKVRVINLVNQNAGDGYLIWRGHEGPAGWELGIELQDRMEDFWGLDF
jgi:PilZ domain-containing protein